MCVPDVTVICPTLTGAFSHQFEMHFLVRNVLGADLGKGAAASQRLAAGAGSLIELALSLETPALLLQLSGSFDRHTESLSCWLLVFGQSQRPKAKS